MTPTPSASQTASADAGEGLTLARHGQESRAEAEAAVFLAVRKFVHDLPDSVCEGHAANLDAMTAAVDRLTALRQTSSEPVAWRWRFDEDTTWNYRDDRAPNRQDCVVQPLYAAPTAPEHAASERVRVLEEALRLARRYVADLPIVGDADLAVIDAALNQSQEKGV